MRPIPLSMRPSTISVHELDTKSKMGGEYLQSFEIKNVRFESELSLNPNEYQLAERATGRIWVDATSIGARHIESGAKIVVNDDEVTVIKTRPLKGFNNRIHHWELDVG